MIWWTELARLMWEINEKFFIYLCASCKIEKNQHILENVAVTAGLILPVVMVLIVSCVGVYGLGMNDHRISNYPVILKVWLNLLLLTSRFPLV